MKQMRDCDCLCHERCTCRKPHHAHHKHYHECGCAREHHNNNCGNGLHEHGHPNHNNTNCNKCSGHEPQCNCSQCNDTCKCGCRHEPWCCCRGGTGGTCPPPDITPQPGTVDIPQPTGGFTGPVQVVGTVQTPPDGVNQVNWFSSQVLNMTRNGPVFGPRKDAFLPWMVVRANAGDTGARPLSGAFWESPDIYALSNTDVANAPLIPNFANGVIQVEAGKPVTLYAHVWNLGKASATRVRVEFYWFDPTLGINRADANLVDAAWIDLGDRFTRYANWVEMTGPSGTYASRGCHAIVKCPTSWVPTALTSHQCLVVRAFEPIMDATPYASFAASTDRHVAQRNIAVVPASSPAQVDLPLLLGYPTDPGTADVSFTTAAPADMPWIGLLGPWATGLTAASSPIVAGFTPPTPRATRAMHLLDLADESRHILLRPSETFTHGCDPLQIQFHASAPKLKHNEGTVLRIQQRQNGEVVGGYTVLLYRR